MYTKPKSSKRQEYGVLSTNTFVMDYKTWKLLFIPLNKHIFNDIRETGPEKNRDTRRISYYLEGYKI